MPNGRFSREHARDSRQSRGATRTPQQPAWRESRRTAGATAVALALTALIALGGAAALADTTAVTGDESVQAPTAWQSYTGLTTAQVSAKLGSSYRLVDVRQEPSGTYAVTMVKNAGAYAVSGWWWYVHQTTAQIAGDLSTNNGRLISLQRNSDGTVNVVMVSNAGGAARSWWWYVGQSTATLSSELTTNNARLVSVSPDPSGGTYSAIMVANTGSDAKTWWWYVGQTGAQVSSLLSTNKARLVDLAVDPSGNFDVIMVSESGTENLPWKWYYGASATAIVNAALNTGYRVFQLVPYTSGGSTVYAGLMINNLATESHRVEGLLESGYGGEGLSGGVFGFYVRPIGGEPVMALGGPTKFEPASAIKALYNLYAEFQVQIGNDSLSSPFNYWYDPAEPSNKDVCPLEYANTPSNEVTTTLEEGLSRMMSVSDNRTTQGVDERYGRSNVNNYAHIIGMTSTKINQTLGCGTLNGGYVTTSLGDLSKLYEGVWSDALLNATRSASFFGRMDGGTLNTGDPLAGVIEQEAAALGKSASASQFIANTSARDKGGSYDVCPSSGPCSPPYVYDRADAGVLTLPFKSGGTIVPHTYTYGWWVNNLLVPCAFGTSCAALTQADNTTGIVRAEELRSQVRAALKTW